MSSKGFQLPEGITLEQLDAYARERENARRRADYRKHPERVERHRLTTYCNFINRHGLSVIPTPPAPPWTEQQRDEIILALQTAMEAQKEGVSVAVTV